MSLDNDGFGLEHKIRLEAGSGRVAGIAGLASALIGPGAPILLISDEGVRAAGLADRLLGLLHAGGHVPTLAAGLAGEPDADAVDAHAALIRSAEPRLVVALGGGSAIDLAKLAASVAGGDGPASDHASLRAPLPIGVPVIAIPTTAGTGAEVTRTAVFSEGGRKLWAWGEALRPAMAVLDPALTTTLPAGVTATGGLDAIVHGLEAATNRRRNMLSEAYGLRAVRLGQQALPDCMTRPDDLAARGAMLSASCLAGLAIDIAGTGAAHALGHALGGVGKVAHGTAVALGLRACLGWNAEGAPDRHEELADILALPRALPLAVSLERWWEETIDRASARDLLDRARAEAQPRRAALKAALSAEENRPMLDANARPVESTDLDLLLDRLLKA